MVFWHHIYKLGTFQGMLQNPVRSPLNLKLFCTNCSECGAKAATYLHALPLFFVVKLYKGTYCLKKRQTALRLELCSSLVEQGMPNQ